MKEYPPTSALKPKAPSACCTHSDVLSSFKNIMLMSTGMSVSVCGVCFFSIQQFCFVKCNKIGFSCLYLSALRINGVFPQLTAGELLITV